jgi:glycine cleavage system aminomethyltransferase T
MQERYLDDYEIVDASGTAIGIVTSGTMSPLWIKGIGLGYVTANSAVDNDIFIRIKKMMFRLKWYRLSQEINCFEVKIISSKLIF